MYMQTYTLLQLHLLEQLFGDYFIRCPVGDLCLGSEPLSHELESCLLVHETFLHGRTQLGAHTTKHTLMSVNVSSLHMNEIKHPLKSGWPSVIEREHHK